MNANQEAQIMEKLGAIEKDTALLRRELLGNGQPGRMAIAEKDIQDLKSERSFRKGVIYSISAIASFITSLLLALLAHGWHAFTQGNHH